jgi:hypothetical protein
MTIELLITICSFAGVLIGGYVKIQLDIQKNTDKIAHNKELLEMQMLNMANRSAEREDRFISSIDKLERSIEDLRKSIQEIQTK